MSKVLKQCNQYDIADNRSTVWLCGPCPFTVPVQNSTCKEEAGGAAEPELHLHAWHCLKLTAGSPGRNSGILYKEDHCLFY